MKSSYHHCLPPLPGRRTLMLAAAGCLIPCAAPSLARTASPYPNKPVYLIVPYSPGGPVDTLARPLAQMLGKRWGQPVIVENKAGASAVIGSEYVARAAPDGYTMLVCNVGEIAILPSTMGNLPYDPLRFAPVTELVSGPMVLVANPGLPFKNLPELIAAAKSKPGRISFASVGPGSISDVAGAMLNTLAKIQLLRIPYKGAGPVMTDLLGGHVDVSFIGISVASPLVKQGKLRALGVSTTKRASMLPDVPAVSEYLPGFEVDSWYGVVAPHGTPAALVQKIYQDISAVMRDPQFMTMVKARGSEIQLIPPDRFAQKIRDDLKRYAEAAKAAGIKPGKI